MAETPRSLTCLGEFCNTDSLGGASNFNKDAGVSVERPATIKVSIFATQIDCLLFIFYPANFTLQGPVSQGKCWEIQSQQETLGPEFE